MPLQPSVLPNVVGSVVTVPESLAVAVRATAASADIFGLGDPAPD